jgi:hypothetical protein
LILYASLRWRLPFVDVVQKSLKKDKQEIGV